MTGIQRLGTRQASSLIFGSVYPEHQFFRSPDSERPDFLLPPTPSDHPMFIMRRAGLVLLTLCFWVFPSMAGTPGTFRGVLVDAPSASHTDGWIFVKGKNGNLRKVEIKTAAVHYEDTFPVAKRKGSPKASLKPGIEVRVTATQGKDGEWHASEVEIVDPDAQREIPPDPDPNHRIT